MDIQPSYSQDGQCGGTTAVPHLELKYNSPDYPLNDIDFVFIYDSSKNKKVQLNITMSYNQMKLVTDHSAG